MKGSEMPSKGNKQLRVKLRTQIAVEKIGVQLNQETRRRHVTADDVLWSVIERSFPVLAKQADKEADELLKQEQQSDKTKNI